jgi:hypothetical protein
MSGKLISRYCQAYRVHCDDFRIFGTPAQRALAAAARQGGDVQQAPGETPQSGPKGNAQSDAPNPFSTPSLNPLSHPGGNEDA